MPPLDMSAGSALFDELAAVTGKILPVLQGAEAGAAQNAQLQAELATMQAENASLKADLAASQQAFADLMAKGKTAVDALSAAAQPAPAAAPAA